MDQAQRLTGRELGHESVGQVFMPGRALGAVTLRCARFLPQFFD